MDTSIQLPHHTLAQHMRDVLGLYTDLRGEIKDTPAYQALERDFGKSGTDLLNWTIFEIRQEHLQRGGMKLGAYFGLISRAIKKVVAALPENAIPAATVSVTTSHFKDSVLLPVLFPNGRRVPKPLPPLEEQLEPIKPFGGDDDTPGSSPRHPHLRIVR